jgi:uncharacterized protein (DUF433 family)
MDSSTLITSDPKIMMGKPVIIGTRITVELILEKLAAGRTQEELLDGYPQLSPESIRAALAFAAKALRADVIFPTLSLDLSDIFPFEEVDEVREGRPPAYDLAGQSP